MKLTETVLRSQRPEPGKRIELRDDVEKGLIFRVTEHGVRSWSVRYRNAAGEQRRKSLGSFPAVGLARAREEARKIKGAVAAGDDLVAVERAVRAEERRKHLHTLAGLADAYFVAAAEGTHRGSARATPKRASTLAEERRIFDKLVKPAFGDSPVAKLTRIEIREFVAKHGRKTPSNGRHCRNIIRQLLSFAVREGMIEHNPAHEIAVPVPTPRDRTLTEDELRAVWQACENPDGIDGLPLSKGMGIALRMAAVTLQRGGEITGMRWSEINRSDRVWLIPADRMKGKRPHVVPLSDLALTLLDEAREELKGEVFVFQSPRSEGPAAIDRRAFSRAMNRLAAELKIPNATPHDLRRTGATMLTSERIGISRFIVSNVLGHSSDTGGAAAVTGRHYDFNDYLPEKRRALDAWAARLAEIVIGRRASSNVTPLLHHAAKAAV